jgi:hypothetical protein
MIYTYGMKSNKTVSKTVLKKYMIDNFFDEGVILDVCPDLRKTIENHFNTPRIHRHHCKEFGFILDKGLVYVPSCMVSIGKQAPERVVLLKDTIYIFKNNELNLVELA